MIFINDLPTELLLEIFKCNTTQDLWHPHDPFQTTIWSSCVCARWRSIIMPSPCLWTETFDLSQTVNFLSLHTLPLCGNGLIDTLSLPSITKTFLGDLELQQGARQSGVLSIAETLASRSFAPPVQVNTKLTTLIPKLIKRARKLILKPPSGSWSLLDTLFSHDVSHLEELVLVKDTTEHSGRRRDCTSANLNLAIEQATSAWNLHSLHLRGCCLNFRSNLAFSNIESLVIHDVPTAMARSPCKLLNAVSHMPKLQHLELVKASLTREFYVHGDAEPFESPDELIELSNLDYFYFDGPISHCAKIFAALDIPLSCSIKLVCDDIDRTDSGSQLHRLLTQLEPRLDSDGFLGESVGIDVKTGVWCLWTIEPSLQDKRQKDKPMSFSIRFSWDKDFELLTSLQTEPIIHPLNVLQVVCNVIEGSFAKVTNLNLCIEVKPAIDPEVHRDGLIALLRPLVNLQHLGQISKQTFEFLLPYFDGTLNECYQDSSSWRDALPFLNSISFLKLDFRHRYPSRGRPRLQHILLDYVSSRFADDNQVPMSSFTLLDCNACISAHFERYGIEVTKVTGAT
ncbi:hypothetical protein GALMADRAFT_1185920 [Galerina marginata CBS 339.88]|uniref:Uncharacterized protein n=1 Tax=Galerina marginata (strain CBS 339.88) TaxID=685588 RepID=A0A067TJX1_GALM3|nr:hypothetical protein GALMADRAFT_1185920 [Galerina marginata CBS 339.88]